MPCASLVNLASASNPTFLSLSGNLNTHAAWTECSLAWRLQLACSLAGCQQLCGCALAALPPTIPCTQKAPVAPSGAPEQVLLLWGSGGRELITRNQCL